MFVGFDRPLIRGLGLIVALEVLQNNAEINVIVCLVRLQLNGAADKLNRLFRAMTLGQRGT